MKIYQRASVIGLAVLLALSLFCAMAVRVDAAQDKQLKITDYYGSHSYYNTLIVVDEATGVNYVVVARVGHSVSITPRLNADGSLYVTP